METVTLMNKKTGEVIFTDDPRRMEAVIKSDPENWEISEPFKLSEATNEGHTNSDPVGA
jgi:hypothetical protein